MLFKREIKKAELSYDLDWPGYKATLKRNNVSGFKGAEEYFEDHSIGILKVTGKKVWWSLIHVPSSTIFLEGIDRKKDAMSIINIMKSRHSLYSIALLTPKYTQVYKELRMFAACSYAEFMATKR